MSAARRSAYPHLSEAEGWLLSTATQSRPAAQVAWERWRRRCAVETAGPKSQALFPMIYANLIEDIGGPDATLLKGVYRRTWYANQLALAQVKPLLEHFAAPGIPVILFNDASVVAGHYPDIGHRGHSLHRPSGASRRPGEERHGGDRGRLAGGAGRVLRHTGVAVGHGLLWCGGSCFAGLGQPLRGRAAGGHRRRVSGRRPGAFRSTASPFRRSARSNSSSA